MILETLEQRVGADNFRFALGNALDLLEYAEDGADDEEDDEFADGEEFETTGESVDS
jgi:hypothetical protein